MRFVQKSFPLHNNARLSLAEVDQPRHSECRGEGDLCGPQCGHAQHVRHRPPWEVRPWVVSDVERANRVGVEIDCPLCHEFLAV
jgi:hypothetical protein